MSVREIDSVENQVDLKMLFGTLPGVVRDNDQAAFPESCSKRASFPFGTDTEIIAPEFN